MIDPETGTLSFDQPPAQIAPAITRAEFLAAPWAKDAETWIGNEPWHSWKLARQCVADSVAFLVVLFFNGESLKMIHLSHTDPTDGTSWNDWSMEKETRRKTVHDKWLTACLGGRNSFPWGSAWSVYDDRAGESLITIRYEPD